LSPSPWILSGGPFLGDDDTNIGISTALSDKWMATGSRRDAGQVKTYLKSNGDWSFVAVIDGNEYGSLFGNAVDLDSYGFFLVVGAPGSSAAGSSVATGLTRFYRLDNDQWTQLGSDIRGEEDVFAANEAFGYSVAVSSDQIVACGAPLSNEDNLMQRGRVYTYRFSNYLNDWIPRQAISLKGDQEGALFGSSVDLSPDGLTLVVGGPGRDDGAGYVAVYSWNGSRWVLDSTLLALTAGEAFGSSVQVLTIDGSIVAAGGPGYEGGKGVIRVYKRLSDGSYSPVGPSIVGSSIDDALGSTSNLQGSVQVINGVIYPVVLAGAAMSVVKRFVFNGFDWEEAAFVSADFPVIKSIAASPDGATSFTVGGSNQAAVYTLVQA
jgi:hypothetical protein